VFVLQGDAIDPDYRRNLGSIPTVAICVDFITIVFKKRQQLNVLLINALSIYQQKTKSTKYQLFVTGNTPVMAVCHRILHTILKK